MGQSTISATEPVLLDLLNTAAESDEDALIEGATGRAWLLAHGGTGAARELADTRQFRDVLAAHLVGSGSAEELNRWAGRIQQVPAVIDGALCWRTTAPDVSAVSARALLEWADLQSTGHSRVRACASPTCGLFFIDRSKANIRKWCDMAVCGNRTKARKYHARTVHAQQAAARRRATVPRPAADASTPVAISEPRATRRPAVTPTRITLPTGG